MQLARNCEIYSDVKKTNWENMQLPKIETKHVTIITIIIIVIIVIISIIKLFLYCRIWPS